MQIYSGTITLKNLVVKCSEDVVTDLDQLKRSVAIEWLGRRTVGEGEQEAVARASQKTQESSTTRVQL
jgi:hypothetical protein